MKFKSSWENEILKDANDKRKSILWALNETETDINKSISGDLMYGDSDLKYINKKGIEVKEKLVKEKSRLEFELIECKLRMSQDKVDSSMEPQGEGKYTYSQIEALNDEAGNGERRGEGRGAQDSMRRYNNQINRYKQLTEEINFISIVINGINEKRDYKLTIRIANELGF